VADGEPDALDVAVGELDFEADGETVDVTVTDLVLVNVDVTDLVFDVVDVTDAVLDAVTDAVTDPVTDAVTDAVTEAVGVSDAVTDAVGDSDAVGESDWASAAGSGASNPMATTATTRACSTVVRLPTHRLNTTG